MLASNTFRDGSTRHGRSIRARPTSAASSRYSRRSHWAICCGDQSSSSLAATMSRNGAFAASLFGSGAAPARTPPRPRPESGTRRGRRCGRSPAIPSTTGDRCAARSTVPTGRPRSHGKSPHDQSGALRCRGIGGIPPDWRKYRRIRGSVSPSVRSISRIGSPRRHIAQITACCSAPNPTGPTPIPTSTSTSSSACSDALTG